MFLQLEVLPIPGNDQLMFAEKSDFFTAVSYQNHRLNDHDQQKALISQCDRLEASPILSSLHASSRLKSGLGARSGAALTVV